MKSFAEAFMEGVRGIIFLLSIILWETLCMVLGMIFIFKFWLMIYRAKTGKTTRTEYQYLRRYHVRIVRGQETRLTLNLPAMWCLCLLVIDTYLWINGARQVWFSFLLVWVSLYTITYGIVLNIARTNSFEPRM